MNDTKCLSIPWIGFPVRPAPELYETQLMAFVNPVPMADNLTMSTSSPPSQFFSPSYSKEEVWKYGLIVVNSPSTHRYAYQKYTGSPVLFTGGFIFQTHSSSASNGAHFRGAPLYKTNSSKLQEFSILLLTVVAV